jgi:c-di-GMP-binding flagellar brake protein YcgR
MVLSADVFDGILKCLKTEQQGANHRKTPRISIRARVTMIPIVNNAAAPAIQAWSRDISKTGIGFLSNTPLMVGQHVVLELQREDARPMRLLCEVLRKERVNDELFVIGAKFLSSISGSASAEPGKTAAA